MKKILLFVLCVCSSVVYADYYSRAENLSDEQLKTVLHDIISANSVRYSFGSGAHHTWEGFYYTDRKEDNSVWDMYSDNVRYFGDMFASIEGIDIEHTFPKSWWGGSVNDGYKDLHLLTPADYSANRSKSNNAMGKVTVASFDNGSFKVGKNPDYGDFKVFEPTDEYKGDFARIFFYVATCYQNYEWVLDNSKYGSYYSLTNSYLTFQPWQIELLLQWHRQDPVSEKELARHEEVYKIQGNRNPFIDYPCLVEYIWGNRKGQQFKSDEVLATSDLKYLAMTDRPGCDCEISVPTLIRPLDGSVIHFEEQSRNEKTTQRIYMQTAQISGQVHFEIDDTTSFTIKQSMLSAYTTNAGTYLDISFMPATLGEHTAKLHITNQDIDATIMLEGLCTTVFHAFDATDITKDGFTAQWSDAEVDEYKLDVYKYPMLCHDSTALDINPLTIANIHAQYNDNFLLTGSVITYQSMLKLGSLERHGDVSIVGLPLSENNHLTGSATQYESDSQGSLLIIADNDTIGRYKLDSTLLEFDIDLPDDIEVLKFAQGDTTQRILIGYLTLSTCHRKPTRQSVAGYPITTPALKHAVKYSLENDTVYYRVTPQDGHESDEIIVYYDPTDVPNTYNSKIKYVTLDNKLYLLNLDECYLTAYNVTGQSVFSAYHTSGTCIIPLPTKGVYIIQINNNKATEHIKIINQ